MSGVLCVTADCQVTGPLANGEAERAVQDWATATVKALGDEGVRMLREFPMNKTGRAHGGFQENLHVLQKGPQARIPAPMIKGVTWGPWLEGTSRRNDSTRFKGYHLFRKTRQELQRKAPEIAEQELAKYLPRMGGS